ncbi:MAG: ABC transporter permease [Chloroflexi bacterium]|nr:ABC transporter permease [Chloroflexota bacterium]
MQETTPTTTIQRRGEAAPLLARAARLFKRQPVGFVSAIILVALIVTAIVGPIAAPYDPIQVDADAALKAPSSAHLFGTDNLGRDLLSRVLQGARISLSVGFLVLLIGVSIGTFVGLVSGYYGGVTDQVIQRLVDLSLTVPTLLLALVIVTALGPSLPNVVIAIATIQTPRLIRLVRSVVLTLKESDYVTAAIALGANDARILTRHILPQTFVSVIVMATLILPNAILVEASLSFLGLGVPEPAPSWGRMLSDARRFLQTGPWMAMAPGILIAITVFSGNMLGDMLRDVLDPRLRSR